MGALEHRAARAQATMRAFLSALLAALIAVLSACGGGGGGGTPATPTPPPAEPPVASPPPVNSPPPASPTDVALLFFGNSHTAYHDVPGLVAAMLRQARPDRSVLAQAAPGYLFLDDRLRDASSLSLFESRGWTHLVLQAQRYSSSGQFSYSTAEAQEWVRLARARNMRPLMFPEWPRRGIDETARIYALYAGIGSVAGACVAPVPQAFDRALLQNAQLRLHDADGNHSSPEGALLAAFILYASASGESPGELGTVLASTVSASTQALLRRIAVDSLAAGPGASAHCPDGG